MMAGFSVVLILLSVASRASGGPIAYAACQLACATGAATIAGASALALTPAAVAAYAACQSACVALLLAPTP